MTLTGTSLLLAQPARANSNEILLVSYAVTKAAYDKIIPLFVADYKKKTGETVRVKSSYGGSGSQTRAVIDGLEADVVGLALAADVYKLQDKGLVDLGWERELPNQSIITNSTVVLFVRPGNPKKIQSWNDLDNKNVDVITAKIPRPPAVPAGTSQPFGDRPAVTNRRQRTSSPPSTGTWTCCPRMPAKPPIPS